MTSIRFFTEDTNFALKNKTKLRHWITAAINQNNKKLLALNYVFTSDAYLLNINKEYLDHTNFTDIITFDQSSKKHTVEADIFISIDRVKENAEELKISFRDELHRVMIHGVLHLLGFDDKTDSEKEEMRKKENHYLALRF
ncbi:MAG: rRNA maturation RNase YbeY [Cytophagales bacterium]|nr:rRNA maturation RNase YbeY [Cytophagales bacterium]